jgi:integrase
MKKSSPYGIHVPFIEKYISYKRSLGYRMKSDEKLLYAISKYACDEQYKNIGFSKAFVDKWTAKRPNESDKTRNTRICCFRGFSFYLQMLGYETYIPKTPIARSNFTPYIYTNGEMSRIFAECDKIKCRHYRATSIVHNIPLILRMLYATGMRISEALSIKHKNIYWEHNVILLTNTKNGQDRLIPISLSLRKECAEFMNFKRENGIDCSDDAYFFSSRALGQCSIGAVSKLFHDILIKAGIPAGVNGKGPRLHDLRHTFCVKSLSEMSKKGIDMYYSMPILMTYVGHKSLASINKYIRLTNENYPYLLNKLADVYNGIFPEINLDNDYEEL